MQWTDEGWVEHGAELASGGPTSVVAFQSTMSGSAPDDLWVRNAVWGHLHWDGRRWTRISEDVRAWISPRRGEAWVLQHDGTLMHRRRP